MPSNRHYICAPCRYVTKYQSNCHYCGGELTDMGSKFHSPRHTNKVQWKKIELAIEVLSKQIHHPNCYYSKITRVDRRGPWTWVSCKCPYFRDFKTPADVKSGRGLRRSDRKNYAKAPHYRGLVPAGI